MLKNKTIIQRICKQTQLCLEHSNTYSEGLGFDANSLVLRAQVQQKFLQRIQVVEIIDSCINHHHHLDTNGQCFDCFSESRSQVKINSKGRRGHWSHLGDMLQELRARQTLGHYSTLGFIVKEVQQSWVQFKQPIRHTGTLYQLCIGQHYWHRWTSAALRQLIWAEIEILHLPVAKQQVKPLVEVRLKCQAATRWEWMFDVFVYFGYVRCFKIQHA